MFPVVFPARREIGAGIDLQRPQGGAFRQLSVTDLGGGIFPDTASVSLRSRLGIAAHAHAQDADMTAEFATKILPQAMST
jgi:hypothetical protein